MSVGGESVRQQRVLRGCCAGDEGMPNASPLRLFNKGLPEQRTPLPLAPVILLTIQAGAVSPVPSDSFARNADHGLILSRL